MPPPPKKQISGSAIEAIDPTPSTYGYAGDQWRTNQYKGDISKNKNECVPYGFEDDFGQ